MWNQLFILFHFAYRDLKVLLFELVSECCFDLLTFGLTNLCSSFATWWPVAIQMDSVLVHPLGLSSSLGSSGCVTTFFGLPRLFCSYFLASALLAAGFMVVGFRSEDTFVFASSVFIESEWSCNIHRHLSQGLLQGFPRLWQLLSPYNGGFRNPPILQFD